MRKEAERKERLKRQNKIKQFFWAAIMNPVMSATLGLGMFCLYYVLYGYNFNISFIIALYIAALARPLFSVGEKNEKYN